MFCNRLENQQRCSSSSSIPEMLHSHRKGEENPSTRKTSHCSNCDISRSSLIAKDGDETVESVSSSTVDQMRCGRLDMAGMAPLLSSDLASRAVETLIRLVTKGRPFGIGRAQLIMQSLFQTPALSSDLSLEVWLSKDKNVTACRSGETPETTRILGHNAMFTGGVACDLGRIDMHVAKVTAHLRGEVAQIALAPVSKAARGSKGIVVTLDALGTLYRFKKPVAEQYIDVARRVGLTANIEADQLSQAFKRAYKECNTDYPNYGLGRLQSPEKWWSRLVIGTFDQIVNEKLPANLTTELYNHFSSKDAYELCSDVQPFLQSIHKLRNQFSDPKGPAILTGIITNSDPRVEGILSSLGLDVGNFGPPTRDEIRKAATMSAQSGQFQTPWANAYDSARDFDFLITGYESGSEKPDRGIWKSADYKASLVAVSKAEQGLEIPAGKIKSVLAVAANAVSHIGRTDNMKWIHIGDDYEKDYLGAKSVGLEALFLDRASKTDVQEDKITSLEEAAVVVNVMAQELLT